MAHSHRSDLVALIALALALLVAVLSSHGLTVNVDAAPAAKVGLGELSVEGPTATLKDAHQNGLAKRQEDGEDGEEEEEGDDVTAYRRYKRLFGKKSSTGSSAGSSSGSSGSKGSKGKKAKTSKTTKGKKTKTTKTKTTKAAKTTKAKAACQAKGIFSKKLPSPLPKSCTPEELAKYCAIGKNAQKDEACMTADPDACVPDEETGMLPKPLPTECNKASLKLYCKSSPEAKQDYACKSGLAKAFSKVKDVVKKVGTAVKGAIDKLILKLKGWFGEDYGVESAVVDFGPIVTDPEAIKAKALELNSEMGDGEITQAVGVIEMVGKTLGWKKGGKKGKPAPPPPPPPSEDDDDTSSSSSTTSGDDDSGSSSSSSGDETNVDDSGSGSDEAPPPPDEPPADEPPADDAPAEDE